MIKYSLHCGDGHDFEGWFRSSDDFDEQAAAGRLECPVCGTSDVRKAIMAPAVARGRGRNGAESRMAEIRAQMAEAAGKARAYVEKNFDYVGESFPEEARRIHYGETEPRAVYGEASRDEARSLIEEGVAVAPLPGPPASAGAGAVKAGPATPALAKPEAGRAADGESISEKPAAGAVVKNTGVKTSAAAKTTPEKKKLN